MPGELDGGTRNPHRPRAVKTVIPRAAGDRFVLVVGLDLDDTSEHLLRTVRELTSGSDGVELHVVHAVHRETVKEKLSELIRPSWIGSRGRARGAQWLMERLCQVFCTGTPVHVVVHTPEGGPVAELTRLARKVRADAIVVESHEHGLGPRRLFHRSVAADLARSAPCSVWTVRADHPAAATG
jgi:hypothetical protein